MTNEKTKQQINRIKGQFAVNPDYSAERTGNYELRNKIASKWANINGGGDGCGNVHHEFYFDTEKQTFIFSDKGLHGDERYLSTYQIISPALFLYRLIATFFGSPKCEDGYKRIWEYNLLHKETGKSISFSEWKGAAGFWLPEYTYKKLTPQFRADLIELMNYLISNECAHPYDGLVAGGIA